MTPYTVKAYCWVSAPPPLPPCSSGAASTSSAAAARGLLQGHGSPTTAEAAHRHATTPVPISHTIPQPTPACWGGKGRRKSCGQGRIKSIDHEAHLCNITHGRSGRPTASKLSRRAPTSSSEPSTSPPTPAPRPNHTAEAKPCSAAARPGGERARHRAHAAPQPAAKVRPCVM